MATDIAEFAEALAGKGIVTSDDLRDKFSVQDMRHLGMKIGCAHARCAVDQDGGAEHGALGLRILRAAPTALAALAAAAAAAAAAAGRATAS